MTGKAVRDTHSNPLVEDIDDYVESPDDLLLSINFSETSNECLQLSVENVDAERFESLQVMDPDIKELKSLAVENVAMEEDNVGDIAFVRSRRAISSMELTEDWDMGVPFLLLDTI